MIKKRKLEFKRQTVANLSAASLTRVAGGAPSNSREGVIRCQTASEVYTDCCNITDECDFEPSLACPNSNQLYNCN